MSKLTKVNIKQDDFNLPTQEVFKSKILQSMIWSRDNFFQLVGMEVFDEIILNLSLEKNSMFLK